MKLIGKSAADAGRRDLPEQKLISWDCSDADISSRALQNSWMCLGSKGGRKGGREEGEGSERIRKKRGRREGRSEGGNEEVQRDGGMERSQRK